MLAGVGGVGGLASSVFELVPTMGSLDAWAQVAASVLMLTVCAILYASESIRELGELRRGHASPMSWEAVGAQRKGNRTRDRVPFDPDAARRRRLWGRLASTMTKGLTNRPHAG